MRTCVFLVSLALLAALVAASHAAPATSQTPKKAKPPLPINLRGSVSPEKPLSAPAPIGLVTKPSGTAIPLATPLASATPNPGQCRTDCAHNYYFCLSGSITAACADTWSQCLSDCSFPPLTIAH